MIIIIPDSIADVMVVATTLNTSFTFKSTKILCIWITIYHKELHSFIRNLIEHIYIYIEASSRGSDHWYPIYYFRFDALIFVTALQPLFQGLINMNLEARSQKAFNDEHRQHNHTNKHSRYGRANQDELFDLFQIFCYWMKQKTRHVFNLRFIISLLSYTNTHTHTRIWLYVNKYETLEHVHECDWPRMSTTSALSERAIFRRRRIVYWAMCGPHVASPCASIYT